MKRMDWCLSLLALAVPDVKQLPITLPKSLVSHLSSPIQPEHQDRKKSTGRIIISSHAKLFIDCDIAGDFFQTAEIDGNFYGIKKADIDEALRKDGLIYVIVNRYAANRFKYTFGERAIRLFIYVNKQTIMERMLARNTPTDVMTTT